MLHLTGAPPHSRSSSRPPWATLSCALPRLTSSPPTSPSLPAQVDLETTLCPRTSLNFLKLCKSYTYNFCSFHNVIKDFIAQTGDPTDTGLGGASIFHLLPKSSPAYSPNKYFVPELHPTLKHTALGTLSMAIAGDGEARGAGSQFFFTLAPELDYLDGKHAPFGRVVEGEDTLAKISEAFTDGEGKPLRDIRIRHVIVLGESRLKSGRREGADPSLADDPFPDPPGLLVSPSSPVPTATQLASLRVGDEELIEESGDPDTIEAVRRARDARAQALTLEMVGDLPFADVAPPENVLFVCKLNQITKSEDLELIFSRFGTIMSCEIICDAKTGDSLQYAFVEFKEKEEAERAYAKMDNVLVDDRRIHVDFSQVRLPFFLFLSKYLLTCPVLVRIETARSARLQEDGWPTSSQQRSFATPRIPSPSHSPTARPWPRRPRTRLRPRRHGRAGAEAASGADRRAGQGSRWRVSGESWRRWRRTR